MSTFWNFVTTLVSGTLARAEDVNTSLSGINTGFNLVETELNKAIQVTNATGVTDISENAAARANKLIAFDASGDVVLSTTIGSYRGNHADAAGTDYYVRDVVKDAAASLGLNNLYICNTAHTSTGDLATDIANWDLLVDVADVEADKVLAESAAAAAAISADFLDDRILGAFTTAAEPTLDNDGNALLTGALYFNTDLNRMKVYNGASWQLTTANAVDVAIADAGGLITATEVEGALQEIAAAGWVVTTRIANNAVNNTKLADMAGSTFKGRYSASPGDPQDISLTQARLLLNVEDGAAADQSADEVPIVDSGGYFSTPEVEAALQELGPLKLLQIGNESQGQYSGAVTAVGPAFSTPSGGITGFSVSSNGVGNKRITHNFGSTDYSIVAIPRASAGDIRVNPSVQANYVDVQTYIGGSLSDCVFDFIINRYS